MADQDIKRYTAEICRICTALYPDEWPGKYTGSQLEFKNWLNEKTSLDVDHRNYNEREASLRAWVDQLKILEALA
jgi:hypothetical protein